MQDAAPGHHILRLGLPGTPARCPAFSVGPFANRSEEHMRRLRERRSAVRDAAQRSASEREAGLGRALNCMVLRAGDRTEAPRDQFTRNWRNQWTTSGFSRLAWTALACQVRGQHRAGSAADVQSSSRSASAMTSFASLTSCAMRDALTDLTERLRSGNVWSIMLQRGTDATPMLVRFGSQQERLQPLARYLVRVERAGRWCWTTVPYSTYRAQHPGAPTSCGVVQVFAQRVKLYWSERDPASGLMLEHHRVIQVSPQILTRATASAQMNAIETGCPTLSLEDLNSLATEPVWIALNECEDNCNTNVRLWAWMELCLNARVLFVAVGCLGHKLHTNVTRATGEEDIVGDAHAMEFVFGVNHRRNQLLEGLWELLLRETDIYVGSPDPSWQEIARQVVSLTLLRDAQTTAEPAWRTPEDRERGLMGDALGEYEGYITRCNGDWRVKKFHVYIPVTDLDVNGGYDRVEVLKPVYGSLVAVGICGGTHSSKPSKSRWGTCNEALGEQANGFFCHDISARLWAFTFPRWELPLSTTPENADFHTVVRGKIYRCVKYTNNGIRTRFAACVAITTVPLDHCQQRCQRESEAGNFFLAIRHRDSSPFVECRVTFCRYLCKPIAETSLRCLWHFYASSREEAEDLVSTLLALVLKLDSGLWYDCEIFFDRPPFSMADFVDVRCADKVAKVRQFLRLPSCDVDPGAGEKVWSAFKTTEDLLACEPLLVTLELWVRHGLSENMGTERLLSLIRRACGPSKTPTVERVVAGGFLAQVRAVHEACGGESPVNITRQRLQSLGAPISASQRPAKQRGQKLRLLGAHTLWLNRRQQAIKAEHGRRPRLEWLASLRELAAEWAQMTPAEQAPFREEVDATRTRREFAGPKDEVGEGPGISAEDRYASYVGGRLWGLSSLAQPVRADVIEQQVRKLCPAADGAAHALGYTDRLRDARAKFMDACLVSEDGPIPKGLRLTRRACCQELHPECCMFEDRAFMDDLLAAVRKLEALFLKGGCLQSLRVGVFCLVRGVWIDGETRDWFTVLANRVRRKPACLLWASCAITQGPMALGHAQTIILRQLGGEQDACVQYHTTSGFLRRFWACDGQLQSLELRILRTRAALVASEGDLGTVYWAGNVDCAYPIPWHEPLPESSAMASDPTAPFEGSDLFAHLRAGFLAMSPAGAERKRSRQTEPTGLVESDESASSVDEEMLVQENERPKGRGKGGKGRRLRRRLWTKASKASATKSGTEGKGLKRGREADIDTEDPVSFVAPSSSKPSAPAQPVPETPVDLDPSSSAVALVPLPPRKVQQRGPSWPRWGVSTGGDLVLNLDTKSCAAHCHVHGPRCRIQRTLNRQPLGYLLLWLDNAGHHKPHNDKGRPSHMHPDYKAHCLAPEQRSERQRLRDMHSIDLDALFVLEASACEIDRAAIVET